MTRGCTTYLLRSMLCMALAAVLLLFGAVPAAAAQPPGPAVSTEPLPGDALRIDNTDLFAGMESTYQNGYMPVVENSLARVVLPLLAVRPVEGEQIAVSVDLGDPASSPFIFRNYDQTIRLREHEANEGAKKVDAYLVDLALELSPGHEPGRYPVALTVSGTAEGGEPFSQSFTVYVTIPGQAPEESPPPDDGSGGEEGGGDIGSAGELGGGGDTGAGPDAAAPTPEPTPAPQPKVLAASYSTAPDPALAGETFLLTVTLRNTSTVQPMRNVKVTVNGEGAEVLPAGGVNSFYFASIPPAKDVVLQTQMKAAQTAPSGPQRIVVHIDYDGDRQTAYSADETITVQVVQPLRVECDEPEIPKEIHAGDTLSVPVNVMDMGRGTVYNVRAQLEAPGLSPEGSLFLGNIESGGSRKGELYAFIGTLGDSSDADKRYGPTSGTLTVTYEDEQGTPFEEVFEFSTYIEPPVIRTPEPEEEEEKPQTQSQWWISALIAGGVIAAAAGIVLYRKRKARREEDNENW